MENKNKLTQREEIFCSSYLSSGDVEKSAILAGYKKYPKKAGERLLGRSDVSDEIARLAKLRQKSLSQMATLGYQRLAFGSVADAVKLLYMENPTPDELKDMDLYSVSEIRKLKDGAMEIRFFDRLKALEKLHQAQQDSSNGASGLYDALVLGAKAISENGDENSEI